MSTVKHQTVLGFDFGLKHIGVAVGQTVTLTATPLASLRALAGIPRWEDVAALIQHWKPHGLIVGLPLALDDSEQAISHAAKHFAEQMAERYQLPVHLVDERFSTLEARRDLFAQGGHRALNKAEVDGWSAKIITESGLKTWKLP